tara:strand:+ start:476 stop:649 length:174 start_codon:yes stop_codon:yes gene_type:complete
MSCNYFGIFTSHIIESHETDNGHEVVLLQKSEIGYICFNKVTGKEVDYYWFQLNPKT